MMEQFVSLNQILLHFMEDFYQTWLSFVLVSCLYSLHFGFFGKYIYFNKSVHKIIMTGVHMYNTESIITANFEIVQPKQLFTMRD